MPRRQAVRLTPRHSISSSSLFIALLQERKAHPLAFQSSAHSLSKTPGIHPRAFFKFPTFKPSTWQLSNALCPLPATLADDLRVLAEISRNCPPATPLDATLTETSPVTPLSATLTKSRGEGHATATKLPVARPLGCECHPRIVFPLETFNLLALSLEGPTFKRSVRIPAAPIPSNSLQTNGRTMGPTTQWTRQGDSHD